MNLSGTEIYLATVYLPTKTDFKSDVTIQSVWQSSLAGEHVSDIGSPISHNLEADLYICWDILNPKSEKSNK